MGSLLLVLSPYEAERKKIIEKICGQVPSLKPIRCEAGIGFPQILEKILSPDLFEPQLFFILDKCELLKKDELASLEKNLGSAYLILSGSSLKGTLEHPALKTFDFTKEKPWDRAPRLKQWIIEEAKAKGKTFASNALSALFDRIGPDYGQLQQELTKLLCFVGEKPSIELKDVQALVFSTQAATGWQLAESLVWEEKNLLKDPPFDFSFLGQIRYHLQLGQQISSLLQRGVQPHEMIAHMPALKPKALDKYLPIIYRRDKDFFKHALNALFECELRCKSSSVSPDLLWSAFKSKLQSTL